jgi:hypothetical protein
MNAHIKEGIAGALAALAFCAACALILIASGIDFDHMERAALNKGAELMGYTPLDEQVEDCRIPVGGSGRYVCRVRGRDAYTVVEVK